MAQYIVKGNRVEVVPDGSLIIKQNLPAGTYFVKYEQSASYDGFYLESSPNFSTSTSIYGDIMERTDRIVTIRQYRSASFRNQRFRKDISGENYLKCPARKIQYSNSHCECNV